MKAAMLGVDIQRHPVKAGLLWGALLLPLVLIISALSGDPFSWRRAFILIPLSIIGGLGWAYMMRWYVRRGNDAR